MRKEMDLISIITPMYNGAKYVSYTIDSVLAQTYSNWEMIIVDDGSKDNGAELVQTYSEKDGRIKLFRQANGGSSVARNNGLKNAKGRYICFLDSDDLWESNFLEEQIVFIKAKQAKIVYASYKRINDVGQEILKPFIVPTQVDYNKLLRSCCISCLTALFDKEQTGDVFFDEKMGSMRDDYVFWLSILRKGGYVYGNQKVLASYRIMNSSTTGDKKKVIKPHFLVYYKVEKLGLFKSIYYLINWAFISFFKYRG